ncbi:MAG: hypothetical protein VX356_05335, partial [Candidatus Thermoplasmatota archaeon]
ALVRPSTDNITAPFVSMPVEGVYQPMFETPFGPVDDQNKSRQKFLADFGETIKIIGGLWNT